MPGTASPDRVRRPPQPPLGPIMLFVAVVALMGGLTDSVVPVEATPTHCPSFGDAAPTPSPDAGVVLCPLTAKGFLNVTNTHLGKSEYWVVRIRAPSDAVPQPDVLNVVAASLLPNASVAGADERPFVFFGELLLSTDDAWAIADALGLQHFPAVLSFHGKTARPIAPKGGLQYGRVMSVPEPISIQPSTKPQKLRQSILSQVPTRYMDPVTTQTIDGLNFVFSRKEVYQISALRREQLALGVLSTIPSRALVLRLDLSQPGDEELLAAASSSAAAAGANIAVFVTEDADVANRFQVGSPRSATVFDFPLPEDVSIPLVPLRRTSEPFFNGCQLAAFVRTAAYDHVAVTAEETAERVLAKWKQDVAAFSTTKPLRKLSTQRDFFSYVEEVKVSIVILFFLRESDDFFMKGYNTAETVAKAIQRSWASTTADGRPNPLASTRDRIRFEVFWIDAEVHKTVASGFKTPSVPSVAFLYGLQDGRRGVRYVYGGKKANEFPTSAELLSFMTGPSLMDVQGGRDMFPLDLSTISFLPPTEVASFYRSRNAKLRVSHANPDDDAMLITDLKMYPTEDAKENTFVAQMVEGKVQFEKHHETKSSTANDDDGAATGHVADGKEKKKSPSSKKQRKLAAEKKRLEAELAEKRRLKEERMQKKAENDERERQESLKKAKETLKQESKQRRHGANIGGGDDAHGSASSKTNNDVVERPKFAPSKGPKNRFLQKKEWEADRKRSMDARLVKDRTTGVLHLNRAFEL